MKPVVALDADGVLLDFIQPVVDTLNELLQEVAPEPYKYVPRTVTEIDDFNMYKALDVPEWAQKKCSAIIGSAGFCDAIEPCEGAIEFVDELRTFAEVEVITTPWASRTWMYEREQSLMRHFGFKRDQINMVHKKQRWDADALVDDKHETIVDYARCRVGVPILLDQPWNQKPTPKNAYRAVNLRHAALLLRGILVDGRVPKSMFDVVLSTRDEVSK